MLPRFTHQPENQEIMKTQGPQALEIHSPIMNARKTKPLISNNLAFQIRPAVEAYTSRPEAAGA